MYRRFLLPLAAAAGIIFAVGAGPLFAASASASFSDGGDQGAAGSSHPCALKTCPE